MNINTLLGIVLLVVGAALLLFGYNASQGVAGQVDQSFMGRLTDATTWYFVFGIAATISGFVMLTFRMNRDTHDLSDLRRTYVDTHHLTDLRRTGLTNVETRVDPHNLTRR